MSTREPINLDELLLNFSAWQDVSLVTFNFWTFVIVAFPLQSMSGLYKKNSKLSNELKSTNKQCSIYQQRVQDVTENYDQLRTTVDKLHGALEQKCNFYGTRVDFVWLINNYNNYNNRSTPNFYLDRREPAAKRTNWVDDRVSNGSWTQAQGANGRSNGEYGNFA